MNQIRTSGSIELHIDYSQSINYAAILNGGSIIKSLAVKNISGQSLNKVCVSVSGFYFPKEEVNVGIIASGEIQAVSSLNALPELNRLLTLSEAVYTEFQVTVSGHDGEIASFRFPLTIQAWNHWSATPNAYQEIGSFVMPNHPYVIEIIEKATSFLQARSRYSNFSGYYVADYGDVVEQVRAIWNALLSENIKYLTINSNYVDTGQRVLTPEMIARNKHGNCLDLSLLLCSCLERIGLSPCLVFVPGHVVAGVWIDPNHSITNSVTTAVNEIKESATSENPTLMLIESTALCNGTKLDDAAMSVISMLGSTSIDFAVDVINARKEGVRSLPVNVTPVPIREDYDIRGCANETKDSSRRQGWERKLLDLTLRNVMLNLKPSKTIVPIWERDTATVVDYIKTNRLAELVGKPEKDNLEQLKNLYRAARTTLEENGANSLFVSLGTLRWYDVDDSRPHIAPLLFIPVSIVRKKAMTYEIRLREDEAMVNVTLIEMLRQMFGVTFPELDMLREDADGFPDWQKVFDIFAAHVTEINKRQPKDKQWELPIQSYIGIFSFTKFLMWHDVHYHPDVIERHNVLRGLIENHYQHYGASTGADARNIEAGSPTDLMLPIDYDSSQLEAVAESHAGQSFVLHGPPGTGKSQTITNMIADAIYHGKRVLFVAEKKAALDVVRTRLNGIGLEPYCLELHSNKADKRSFFSQVEGSGISVIGSHTRATDATDDYASFANTLQAAQRHLNGITEAIHSTGKDELSLYDCVNRLLTSGYNRLALSYSAISHLSPDQIDDLIAEFRSLDLVAQILGYHPEESDLQGFYPRENTASNQSAVVEMLNRMPQSISAARRKALSLINRWFKKRTPFEILRDDAIWKRLRELVSIDENKACDIDTLAANVVKWNNAIDGLRRWYHFSAKAIEIGKYQLPQSLSHYLAGASGEETANAVYGGYYAALSYYVIDNDSRLRGFHGRLHESQIDRYCKNVSGFQAARRTELVRKMERQIIDANISVEEKKQLALLARRTQTNGRGVALRKIIGDSSEVLARLFPCMLMSPLSVAQYLEMKPEQFDLIIFDEASQMETSDAVGTIARGRSLVVVGDPLQLPPTRFFTSQTTAGEEIEESEDSNSILEDCIALGMPSRYLSRHYRSRHESLIAFSNSHFYENRLLTFPSHNDSERKVSFINPDGVYDYGKSRTNRIEAEAVVKHIVELLDANETAPSIGVVAFSKAQSNLIEDILNAKLQRNKVLQKKLDDASEPLFIKNLENVQGDERDIIIFSIGYGPDKDGNVSLNFGPLNQSGGERRLNVAVSRAREEMIVYSSLMPQHIPSEGIAAKGVAALRNFLAFAIDGKMTRDNDSAAVAANETIVENIADRLREKGLNVVTKVGRSAFKIDLAIVDESNPDNYRLGIILDGRDYHALPTVRDREITVPSVLRALGWRLYRLWTIDYLENPETVIKNIISRI